MGNIGFLGLGKLGLPCALAVASKGHKVFGYDTSLEVRHNVDAKKITYREELAQDYFDLYGHNFEHVRTIDALVENSDIIFVAIQTPHEPLYEGITRIPSVRADFDYTYLISGIRSLNAVIDRGKKDKIVVIISTVLPGTTSRYIRKWLSQHVKLCYNPFFIAMGTTINDFLNPEFVLLGVDDKDSASEVETFYGTIHNKPVCKMSIESAELAKVAYNTFIGMKIVFVNTLMEICQKIPNADVDDVTSALKKADSRLISTKYMDAGMGDGGGCHPRDNIALSWLSKQLNLSHDIFDNLMMAREHQTEWLVEQIKKYCEGREVVILGRAFKPETSLTVGSPAILLKSILNENMIPSVQWDPWVDDEPLLIPGPIPRVYFVGTKHPYFQQFPFEEGAIVIDPWRYIPEKDGVHIIKLGIGK